MVFEKIDEKFDDFDRSLVAVEKRYYDWWYTKNPLGKAQCAIEKFCGMETTYDQMLRLVAKKQARLDRRVAVRLKDGL